MEHHNQRRNNNPHNLKQNLAFQPKCITAINHKLLKFFLSFTVSAIILMLFGDIVFANTNEQILITINKFVSHPALDAVEQGIIQALQARGLNPNKALIKTSNAQGNITNSIQIAKHQASLQPEFMVAIATPAAQANFKARTGKTMVAFAAVTDPLAAGITATNQVIGVTDQPPILELINAAQQILPNLKTLGVIFNPGEINSVKMVESIEKLAIAKNIKVNKVAVTTSANILTAMQKLVSKVEIIYLPQDNTVISALDSIVQTSLRAKIPVITNDPSLIDSGVLLAIGADYFAMGVQLGNMMVDIMENKAISDAIQMVNIKETKMNHKTAAVLGLEFPDSIPVDNCKAGAQ